MILNFPSAISISIFVSQLALFIFDSCELFHPQTLAPETSLRTLETSLRTLETALRTLETSLRMHCGEVC